MQNFDEIFRETDQDSIHAPIGGEVSRDNSPHWTRRKNGFPWNPAFLKQTVNIYKDLINHVSPSSSRVSCLIEVYASLLDARQPLLHEYDKVNASKPAHVKKHIFFFTFAAGSFAILSSI